MKRLVLVLLPLVAGCLSFNETYLEFTRLAGPEGVRFYVASLELSDGLRKLPIGEGDSGGRGERVRRNLVKNCGALFSDSPEGAIPLRIDISARKNFAPPVTGQNINESAFNGDGIMESPPMLIVKTVSAKLTYEVKCQIQRGGASQTVTKPVNSFANRTEMPVYPGLFILFWLPASDNLRLNGFGLFPSMVDDYDWLMGKDFADVVASAVAEFDLGDK